MADPDWPRVGPGPPYLLIYAIAYMAADIVLIFVDPILGATGHAALLLVATVQLAFGRAANAEVTVAAILPLTRLLSLAIGVQAVGPAVWVVLVAVPLLVATILVARATEARWLGAWLGRPSAVGAQALIALLGLPVGWLLSRPGLEGQVGVAANPLPIVALTIVLVALFEELLFRGLIQRHLAERSEVLGLFAPAAIYAGTYVGSGSAATIASMAAIGLAFSLAVSRSGSLWGVLAAHVIGRLLAGIG